MVIVFGFGFVFSKSFVDSATESIMEARTRLFTLVPASSPEDRATPAGYVFPSSGGKKNHVTILPASASSLTKVLLSLSEEDIVHTWGGSQAGVGLTGSPKRLESEAPGKAGWLCLGLSNVDRGLVALPSLFSLLSLPFSPTQTLWQMCPCETGP